MEGPHYFEFYRAEPLLEVLKSFASMGVAKHAFGGMRQLLVGVRRTMDSPDFVQELVTKIRPAQEWMEGRKYLGRLGRRRKSCKTSKRRSFEAI